MKVEVPVTFKIAEPDFNIAPPFPEVAELLSKVVLLANVIVPALALMAPPLAEVLLLKVVAPLKVDVPIFPNAPPSVVEALVVKAVVPPSVKVASL